jgi:hypothetical protein
VWVKALSIYPWIKSLIDFYRMKRMEIRLRQKLHEKRFVLLKKEGGLGLKCLEVWNMYSILRHIWNLFAQSSSIWVAWVQIYLLRGRSFWNISIPKIALGVWGSSCICVVLLEVFSSLKWVMGRTFIWG